MKLGGQWKTLGFGALLVILAACGGEDSTQPLGLFSTNISQSALDDPQNPSWVLAGSDVGLSAIDSEQSTVSTTKNLAPLFGVQRFFPGMAKSVDGDQQGPICRQSDAMHVTCSVSVTGPLGGNLWAEMTVEFRELTQTKGDGTADLRVAYNGYAFTEAQCGKTISLEGVFSCSIEMQAELSDSTHADVDLKGVCNTAQDPDSLLEVNRDNVLHHIGYDLAVNYQGRVDLRVQQPFQFDETNVTGIVAVDGVNYSYAELQQALNADRCE